MERGYDDTGPDHRELSLPEGYRAMTEQGVTHVFPIFACWFVDVMIGSLPPWTPYRHGIPLQSVILSGLSL